MSKIAALQARLGGGAGIMMGLKPGGAPPVRKKKERRHSLDNPALNRPVNKNTAKKRRSKKLTLDDYDEDEKKGEDFGSSLVGDIDASKALEIDKNEMRSHTPDPSPSNKKYNLQMKSLPHNSKPLGSVNRKSKDFRGNLTSGRARSGTLKSSCELVSNDMDNDNTITVKFYHSWDKYFTSEAFADVVKGFKISTINDNAFGNELKDTGIQSGWKLVKIGKRTVGSKNYTVIRGDLEKNSKFGGKGGYNATFLCIDSSDDKKEDNSSSSSASKPTTSPASSNASTSNTASPATNKSSDKSPSKSPSKPLPVKKVDKYDRMASIELERKRSSSSKASPVTEKRSSTFETNQRQNRGRSVANDSAALLIEENSSELKKTVKLIEKIVEYIDSSQASTARKGFRIDAMNDTVFAKELMKLGIKGSQDYKDLNNPDAFWTISGIGATSVTQDLSKKNYINIRDMLTKEHSKAKLNGYLVTFKANIKDIWIDSAITSPTTDTIPEQDEPDELPDPPIKTTPIAVAQNVKPAETKPASQQPKTEQKEQQQPNKIPTKTVPKPALNKKPSLNKKASNGSSSRGPSKSPKTEEKESKEENTTPQLTKKKSGPASVDRPKGGDRGKDNAGPSVAKNNGNNSGGSGNAAGDISVELIDENIEEQWKEVRLKYAFDKYFGGERDDSIKSGMKGFMITSIVGTSFGKDFRNLGISNKWRIWKINELDVSKLNHMVLRNKLTMAAKARNVDTIGYNVTFISPDVQLENLKNYSHGDGAAPDLGRMGSKPKSIDVDESGGKLTRQKSNRNKSPAGKSPNNDRSPRTPNKKGGGSRPGSNESQKTELKTIGLENRSSNNSNKGGKPRGKSPRSANNKNKNTNNKGGGTKMNTVPKASGNKGRGGPNQKGKNGNSRNDNSESGYENNDELMRLKKEIQQLKQENAQLKLENTQLRDQLQSRKGSIPITNSTTNSADVPALQVAKEMSTDK